MKYFFSVSDGLLAGVPPRILDYAYYVNTDTRCHIAHFCCNAFALPGSTIPTNHLLSTKSIIVMYIAPSWRSWIYNDKWCRVRRVPIQWNVPYSYLGLGDLSLGVVFGYWFFHWLEWRNLPSRVQSQLLCACAVVLALPSKDANLPARACSLLLHFQGSRRYLYGVWRFVFIRTRIKSWNGDIAVVEFIISNIHLHVWNVWRDPCEEKLLVLVRCTALCWNSQGVRRLTRMMWYVCERQLVALVSRENIQELVMPCLHF